MKETTTTETAFISVQNEQLELSQHQRRIERKKNVTTNTDATQVKKSQSKEQRDANTKK